jgi:hypothetical protein
MGLRTQQLKGLNGGLNAVAQDLESLEGPTQSPDLLNCYGLPGTVFSRLGSAPWWDTGGTGPLYWFSFFEPLKLGDGNGGGTTIDGDGWSWPTAPTYPGPVPRSSSYLFRILTPAEGTLGVDPEAILNITWERRRGALGYKVQIKNFDTGVEVFSYEKPDRVPSYSLSPSFAALERSKKYTIKVWAILAKSPEGAATQLEQTTNTRTFNTLLSVPTNLAPVGEIATLTPTFTCDAVTKAVRYKVRIYAADSVTVVHTSIALLLPSYPLGAGVLTDYATKYWSFTAYADAACTAAYGVESGHEIIYKIELDDTLADGTVGVAYTGTVTATGGTGPYTYAVTSGTLPAGLTLASNGAVTGTPTTAATSAFTVTATDANGNTGSREYSVTVATAEVDVCTIATTTNLWLTGSGISISPMFTPTLHDLVITGGVLTNTGGPTGTIWNGQVGTIINDNVGPEPIPIFGSVVKQNGQLKVLAAFGGDALVFESAEQACGTTVFANSLEPDDEVGTGGTMTVSLAP